MDTNTNSNPTRFFIGTDTFGYEVKLFRDNQPKEVDGLPTRFPTSLDLTLAMPTLMEWVKGNVARSMEVHLLTEDGGDILIDTIFHCTDEVRLNNFQRFIPGKQF